MAELTDMDVADAFVRARRMAAHAAAGDQGAVIRLLKESDHPALVAYALARLLARLVALAAPGENIYDVLERAGDTGRERLN